MTAATTFDLASGQHLMICVVLEYTEIPGEL